MSDPTVRADIEALIDSSKTPPNFETLEQVQATLKGMTVVGLERRSLVLRDDLGRTLNIAWEALPVQIQSNGITATIEPKWRLRFRWT